MIGVLASSALMFGLVQWVFHIPGYPRSIYLIDSVLLVTLMGGLRLMRRVYREASRVTNPHRVLVLGAGDAGEMIVRDMFKNVSYGMTPIGFIDDNLARSGSGFMASR